MSPDFSVADTATWPMVLSVAQVAAIYGRQVGGVAKHCQQGRFVPAPFLTRPFRFRKADVVRHVEGGRSSLRRVS